MAIQSTSRNSFTCCPSTSIVADGEHQHMAQLKNPFCDRCRLSVLTLYLLESKGLNVANWGEPERAPHYL